MSTQKYTQDQLKALSRQLLGLLGFDGTIENGDGKAVRVISAGLRPSKDGKPPTAVAHYILAAGHADPSTLPVLPLKIGELDVEYVQTDSAPVPH